MRTKVSRASSVPTTSNSPAARYKLDVMKDLWGRRIYTGDRPSFEKLEGKTIALTIDERIQYIAELGAVARFEAKAGQIGFGDRVGSHHRRTSWR